MFNNINKYYNILRRKKAYKTIDVTKNPLKSKLTYQHRYQHI